MNNELTEYALRAGPGIGVGGLSLFGLPLQDWVYILTAVYTILQIGLFLWNRYNNWRKSHEQTSK